MGLFDKVFDEIGRGIEKFGTKDVSTKKARGGRFSGSEFLSSSIGAGGLTKGVLGSANRALKAQAGGKVRESASAGDDAGKAASRSLGASVFGANVGHQAIFGVKEDNTSAPGAQPLPNVGGNERSARAQARQRAM